MLLDWRSLRFGRPIQGVGFERVVGGVLPGHAKSGVR
jgi:hypothetical protein